MVRGHSLARLQPHLPDCCTRSPVWYVRTRQWGYMGQRTSVYLDDALHAAAKAPAFPLAEFVRRALAASTAPGTQATP